MGPISIFGKPSGDSGRDGGSERLQWEQAARQARRLRVGFSAGHGTATTYRRVTLLSARRCVFSSPAFIGWEDWEGVLELSPSRFRTEQSAAD